MNDIVSYATVGCIALSFAILIGEILYLFWEDFK